MSDLTSIEKLKLETFLQMNGGYVLNFSNRTFQEFIIENSSIDIYSNDYNCQSGSKANRLRALWKREANPVVGKLLSNLLEYWKTQKVINHENTSHEEQQLFNECSQIVERLTKGTINKKGADLLERRP